MNAPAKRIALEIATPAGVFRAHYSARGLAELNFPAGRPGRKVNRGAAEKISGPIRRWHRFTATALKAILAGRPPRALPPLDLVGTEFQQSVWSALQKISIGQTQSYGEIARAIGRPRAVRAVGGACGANPIPVLIPCHRVLAANRRLGGFSGGLVWKIHLLQREGVTFAEAASLATPHGHR